MDQLRSERGTRFRALRKRFWPNVAFGLGPSNGIPSFFPGNTMSDQELTTEQFVEKCLAWLAEGKPMLWEFPFDSYIKIEAYRNAIEARPEWREYWRNFGQIRERGDAGQKA